MRRLLTVLLLACLLLLTACDTGPYTVECSGSAFTVDPENKTITQGSSIYHYEIGQSHIRITYPNGTVYSQTIGSAVNTGTWSGAYEPDCYPEPDVLLDALFKELPQENFEGNLFLTILCFGLGLWNVLSPKSAWYISHGWRYKNAEPSDLALLIARVSGVILLVMGVFLTVIGI